MITDEEQYIAIETGVQAVQWTGAPELVGAPSSGATNILGKNNIVLYVTMFVGTK